MAMLCQKCIIGIRFANEDISLNLNPLYMPAK